MIERESTPRGFEHTYQSFLWRELSIIRELERNGDYYQALELAVSLLKYLAPEIREKQQEQARIIINKVRRAIKNCPHIDFYTKMVAQNKISRRLGAHYLEQVITTLSDHLAHRLYMEKTRRYLEAEDFRKIEENE